MPGPLAHDPQASDRQGPLHRLGGGNQKEQLPFRAGMGSQKSQDEGLYDRLCDTTESSKRNDACAGPADQLAPEMKNPEFITDPKIRRGVARGLYKNHKDQSHNMQGTFSQHLQKTLSEERLDAYRQRLPQPTSDRQILGCYAWNMALSESLYSSLQILEIAMRNTIHHSAAQHFGQDTWFDNAGALQHAHERDAIQKARQTLTQQGRTHDAGRIVAEVSFGFWTSLLDKRYEQILWPRLLRSAFPHMPRRLRTRAMLSKRFHTVRQLRNRVFHHEPIWHWHDLAQHHRDILEALAWIDPNSRDFVETIDRFPNIHAKGPGPFEAALQKFC